MYLLETTWFVPCCYDLDFDHKKKQGDSKEAPTFLTTLFDRSPVFRRTRDLATAETAVPTQFLNESPLVIGRKPWVYVS